MVMLNQWHTTNNAQQDLTPICFAIGYLGIPYKPMKCPIEPLGQDIYVYAYINTHWGLVGNKGI